MHYRPIRRGWWRRCGALALAFAATACSTHSVTLRATVGDDLNPVRNKPDTCAALNLHAYFLKKTDRFQPEAQGVEAFLGDIGKEPTVPDFLGDDAVRVVRMVVPPTEAETVVQIDEVPKEAEHVGLVAFFQWHEENDPAEVWSLVVPVRSGTVAFRVAGRRLEQIGDEPEPVAAPEPAPTPEAASQPSGTKEAPRDRRRR